MREVALITESFGEASAEMPRRIAGIIGVVAVGFSGRQNMKRVMDVVIPLRVVFVLLLVGTAAEVMSGIVEVFKHQVNLPVMCESVANGARELSENIGPRIINNGINRIQTQAVEVVFLKPVERIVNEI